MGQVPLVTLWALVSPQENGADGCVRSDDFVNDPSSFSVFSGFLLPDLFLAKNLGENDRPQARCQE